MGGLVFAAAAEKLEDGEEDVDGVEVDGEGQDYGGLAVSAGADACEVADGEEGEDAEDHPGVGAGIEEVEEDAGDAEEHDDEECGESDSGDAAVVDIEEVGDAAHGGHSEAGGGGGLEDEVFAEAADVAVDEWADLPAHEVGEGHEEAKGESGAGAACGRDGEDEAEDGDEAGEGAPGRCGGDAECGDEEAEGGDGEDLGKQGSGLFARCVDDGGIGVGAEVVHGHCLLR